VILTAHIVLLLLFVTVTAVLLMAAVVNRLRIQPARMIWYHKGLISGIGWSSLFLVMFVGAIIYAGITENSLYLYLGLGYLIGGICWCVAMRLSSATIITDFAIVKDTSKCGNVLCWNQVVDFFIHDKGRTLQYTFLYVNNEGVHARFDVQVPHTYQRGFSNMVHRCVERKKSFTPEKAYG
jgi:hypothetical protein